jgi:4'-phosphopantetheinyl transferase
LRHDATVQQVLALGDDEVHVHWADPRELSDLAVVGSLRGLLAQDERERMDRYVFERDRGIFLATHAVLRAVLSLYVPVSPTSWRFANNEYGRPEITGDPPPLRFNVSNTEGLVACAVTRDADIGVDVEGIGRTAPLEVAEQYFAPAEVAALRALPPARQHRRFFELWTLKESYIKARGMGLAIPLHHFAFTVRDGAAPSIAIDPALGDSPEGWQFSQGQPTPDHLLALCVRRRNGRDKTVVMQRRRLCELGSIVGAERQDAARRDAP